MALPTTDTSWTSGIDLPTRLFGAGSKDFELYEEEGEFVLSIEMPGYERDEIDVRWNDGRLNVSAEHMDDDRGRKRTYHRTFRFPKDVEDEGIEATYESGVLEIALPVAEQLKRGTEIEVH